MSFPPSSSNFRPPPQGMPSFPMGGMPPNMPPGMSGMPPNMRPGMPPNMPSGMPGMPPGIPGMPGMVPMMPMFPMNFIPSAIEVIPERDIVPAPIPKTPLCDLPNNTVYVSNLNEKVNLKMMLKTLKHKFSKFGKVIDIKAQFNLRMKGQAFVIYEDVEAAKKAVKEANSQPLYNKIMVVQFSTNKSSIFAEREGTLQQHRRERYQRMVKRLENRSHELANRNKGTENGDNPDAPTISAPVTRPPGLTGSRNKSIKPSAGDLVANKILFIQHLPDGLPDNALAELFKQYPGFKEVRQVPGRGDIAFVEYELEAHASIAKASLNNFPIKPDYPMKITYAKR